MRVDDLRRSLLEAGQHIVCSLAALGAEADHPRLVPLQARVREPDAGVHDGLLGKAVPRMARTNAHVTVPDANTQGAGL